MASEQSFQDLMARVRTGNSDAVSELIARYGGAIKRAARVRMLNARLRRVYGSEDVFQSVIKSFCLRYASDENEWQIETPAELANLLASMTQNKVSSKARKESALRRGGNREITPIDINLQVPGAGPRPDVEVETKEEYEKYWKLFDQDARALFLMRFEAKLSWDEIGAALGSTGDACRKKLNRVLKEARQKGAKPSPQARKKNTGPSHE